MKKTISVLKHAVAGALLFSPLAVLAQATPTPTATLPRPVSDISGFLGYICTGANLLFTVIMVLSVLILLFAAFLFLTSGGDEEKTGSARKYLTYAIVGMVVAILARGLVLVVGSVFGANLAGQTC